MPQRDHAFIPICDPAPQITQLDDALLAAAARVIRSGGWVLGEEVVAFESAAAAYLGARHAIGVNSGTDALTIALAALNVGPGDEVITSAFTFFGTAEAVSRLGATPHFVDIDPATFNLVPEQVGAAVGPRTRCIVPVHLFGAAADMDALAAIAADAGLPLVEDVAQAFGARWKGRRLGTIGRLGAFSFYPTKNLGGFGDGGLIVTDDDALAERCRQLRNHGNRGDGVHVAIGFNSRLDALQAALLRVKLDRVDGWNEQRREIARRYNDLLRGVGGVTPPTLDLSERHVWHQYTVRVPGHCRDRVVARLRQAGVGAMVYYSRPLHRQPIYRDRAASLPEAERAAAEVVSLPISPGLAESAQERVVATLAEVVAEEACLAATAG